QHLIELVAEPVARFNILGNDNHLPEIRILWLHVEGKNETDGTLPDIGAPMIDIWIAFKHRRFKLFHLGTSVGDGTVLRQRPVEHQFRSVGFRKELPFYEAHAEHGSEEKHDRRDDRDPLMTHRCEQNMREYGEEAT